MNDSLNNTKLKEELKEQAKFIAVVVRNALEDFHSKYLTDEQMKKLNPIIRNAVFTALYAHKHCEQSSRAREFMKYHVSMIPDYWEEPELLEGFEG